MGLLAGNAGKGGCLRLTRMIGIEIEQQDQFREQFVPIYLKPKVRKLETEYQSVVSPPKFLSGFPGRIPCRIGVRTDRQSSCRVAFD